jgi:hypothetical protein
VTGGSASHTLMPDLASPEVLEAPITQVSFKV